MHRLFVREGNRVTSQRSEQPVRNHNTSDVLTSACVLLHHCVRHTTLFPSRACTDAKANDIINGLDIYFES